MTNDNEMDFSQALEDYLDQNEQKNPEVGEICKGVIIDITEEGMSIGLGLKQDGFVPAIDIAKLNAEERAKLAPEQEIHVYVVSVGEPENSSVQLSVHRALLNEDWIKAQELLASGEITEGEVIGYNRGGALVDFGRLRGFIPLSQLNEFRNGMNEREKQRLLSKLRNQLLPLKIIEVDRVRRRLVLSHREAHKEWVATHLAARLASLQVGDVVKGRVTNVRPFGAFIDIGDGVEGLVHVSELAWHRVDHPSQVLKQGDEFEVIVLSIDEKAERIGLSRKQLLKDPWAIIDENYRVGNLIEGTITRLVTYGAFVEIEPGVEGLLHSSKLARTDITDPAEVVREGERHLLRVIGIDKERQRIALSLKAVTAKEQIEWMMGQETPAAQSITAVAEEVAEIVTEIAETVAENTEEVLTEVVEMVETTLETVETPAEAPEPIAETVETVVENTEEVLTEVVEMVETALDTAEAPEETTDPIVETEILPPAEAEENTPTEQEEEDKE